MRNLPLIRRRQEPFFPEFGLGRLMDEFFKMPFRTGWPMESVPVIDVYEKNGKVVVKAELPGASPEDIRLSVDGNLLTLSGEKKVERETKKEDYYQLERSYGRFQRVVELPADVKAEEAKAAYKNGVLTVELPKSESQRKRDIKIERD